MKCPGQDMKYWKNDAIFDENCPKCGKSVEFYKDDSSRKCNNCGHRFINPKMDFGCASYCQFAEQCLGTLPEEFTGIGDDLLKDKVAVEIKRYFRTDLKSIRRATDAANHAESIGKAEGGNLAVVLCAAYLHGIELEMAQSILKKVGAAKPMVEEIYQVLKTRENVNPNLSLDTKILHDALTLKDLQEHTQEGQVGGKVACQATQQELYTNSAKVLAADLIS